MELIADIVLVAVGIAIGHFFPKIWDTAYSWFRKAPGA